MVFCGEKACSDEAGLDRAICSMKACHCEAARGTAVIGRILDVPSYQHDIQDPLHWAKIAAKVFQYRT